MYWEHENGCGILWRPLGGQLFGLGIGGVSSVGVIGGKVGGEVGGKVGHVGGKVGHVGGKVGQGAQVTIGQVTTGQSGGVVFIVEGVGNNVVIAESHPAFSG